MYYIHRITKQLLESVSKESEDFNAEMDSNPDRIVLDTCFIINRSAELAYFK